jgi:hypothetical protein
MRELEAAFDAALANYKATRAAAGGCSAASGSKSSARRAVLMLRNIPPVTKPSPPADAPVLVCLGQPERLYAIPAPPEPADAAKWRAGIQRRYAAGLGVAVGDDYLPKKDL